MSPTQQRVIWPKASGETEKPCSRGLIRFRLTFFSKTTTVVLSASFRLLVMQRAIDKVYKHKFMRGYGTVIF